MQHPVERNLRHGFTGFAGNVLQNVDYTVELFISNRWRELFAAFGSLRITAGVSFGRRFIIPLLGQFFSQYPAVDVQLHLSDETENIIEAGYDLAIRISAGMKSSGLVAKKLADSRRILCAAPSYLEKHGTPKNLAELSNHHCLVLTGSKGHEDVWELEDASARNHRVRVKSSLTSNLGDALYQAALSGLGISLHSTWHIQDDLNAGRMQVVLPNYFKKAPIYAVMPQRQFVPARVKAFIEFIKENLREA